MCRSVAAFSLAAVLFVSAGCAERPKAASEPKKPPSAVVVSPWDDPAAKKTTAKTPAAPVTKSTGKMPVAPGVTKGTGKMPVAPGADTPAPPNAETPGKFSVPTDAVPARPVPPPVEKAERTEDRGLAVPAAPQTAPQEKPLVEKVDKKDAPGLQKPEPAIEAVPAVFAGVPLPEVIMSRQHEDMCRVKVGDAMPEVKLPDIAGKEQTLSALRGERLTLVAFWRVDDVDSRQLLIDLEPDFVKRYARYGMKVVTIGCGRPAEETARHTNGTALPVLVDADGGVLNRLATGHVPRLYLLDAAGKIVWLDLEYSLSTRRHLDQAIRAALGKTLQAAAKKPIQR